jgi:TetR/AcrR family transcriptional regulator
VSQQAKKNRDVIARNPDRSRNRILDAALKEFSARGFAGARVDAIARHAKINKRMLYHYFGDKAGLFREVLRRKLTERRALIEGASGNPCENLPFRFAMMCRDLDWVRLLCWEAVQYGGEKIFEEKFRRAGVARARTRVRREQAQGLLSSEFGENHLLLAKLSLTMFPVAFPQLTQIIMGKTVRDPAFQHDYAKFLKQFAVAFQPVTQRARRKGK